jgi:hypothetical protein
MDRIYNEQGPDKFVPVAWYSRGGSLYVTPEAQGRAMYYGVNAYPWTWFDGVLSQRGAGATPEDTYYIYLAMFNTRRVIASPLTIEFIHRSYGENKASVKVKLKLEQSISEGHVCHIVLWEDKVANWYRFVERRADNKPVTITNANDTQEIGTTFTLDSGWNAANLGVSVFVQHLATKEIKQGRATMLVEGVGVTPTSLGRVKALYN